MKRIMKPILGLMLVSLLLVAGSGESRQESGQENDSKQRQMLLESVSADSVGDRAAQLVARIKNRIDRSDDFLQKLAAASVEDSLVLELQIAKLQVQVMADIHELVDILVELEQKGPQEQLRIEVEETLAFATPLIWRHINSLRQQIDAARSRRHSTAAVDRPTLEDRIAKLTERLNAAYEIGRTQIEKLEKLGLDASYARTTYTKLLADRADELSGRIDLALERIDELSARLSDMPDNTALAVLLVAAHKSLETNTSSMTTVLHIMDTLELPTADYRAQLVTATRDYATGLLDRDVAVSLLGRAANRVKSWLADNGPGLMVKLLLFFGILFVFRVLARLVRKGVGRALDASKLNISTLLRRMVITSAANAVMILGLLIALSQLGISLGPLLAGLGVAGFIIGFALQDTLANFAAGMMILIYRPYDVGDMVDAGGVFGKVNKMSLVSTTILTIDNQTIVVPNSKIWGDVIKNVTDQAIRRVDMVFGVSYSDDIPKAEQLLMDILKQHDKVLDDPEPAVKLHKLGESSVDFVVRPWVTAEDYWDVYWDVTRAVKMRFDEEEISIPFPQRDVHIYEEQITRKQEVEKKNDRK